MSTSSLECTFSLFLVSRRSNQQQVFAAPLKRQRKVDMNDRTPDLRGGKLWTRDGEFWRYGCSLEERRFWQKRMRRDMGCESLVAEMLTRLLSWH